MHIKLNIGTKALLLISSVTFIIFSAAIGYISIKSNKLAMEDAKELTDSHARQNANLVMSNINVDMITARALANAFQGYKEINYDKRTSAFNEIMRIVALENPNFLSVWANWELQARDTSYHLPYGRARFTIYRDVNGNILYYTDTLNLDGDDLNSAYYGMKVSKKETVMEPYTFSYEGTTDEILETSVCAPILENGKFIGLAGIDLGLNRFENIISSIKPFTDSYAFLVSNGGIIISHKDKTLLGKSISEIMPDYDKNNHISEKIQKGRNFSFTTKDGHYISFASFNIGDTDTPWSIGLVVPVKVIVEKARRHLKISIFVGVIGLILLSIFIWIVSKRITSPLITINELVKKLALGEIDKKQKLDIKSGDEIEEIVESVNKLIDGLNTTAEFASEIGKGNLDAEFNLLSEKDTLGNSLLEMRKSLIYAADEEKARKIEDEKQNWTTKGMNKFSEILRQNNDNIKELSFQLMSNLIEYVGATQGAMYVINKDEDGDANETYFEMTSAIAYGRDRLVNKKIKLGDELVGRCAFEQLTIYMVDVPKDYVNITSGLGKANPNCILLVPLKLNEEIFGVVELISFNEIEPHQIEFVEHLGTSIASTISAVKVNEKTASLLKQSQKQAEELASQEEEMRQNLEELQATQEEATRRETEMGGILKALNENLLVMELDMDGKVMTINESFCQLLGMRQDQIIGRRHSDLPFLKEENVRSYSELWQYFKEGISKREITKLFINNEEVWLSETFTPILDMDSKPYKVLNMAINITKSKLSELKFENLEKNYRDKSKKLSLKEKELIVATDRIKSIENELQQLEEQHKKKIIELQNNYEKQISNSTKTVERKFKTEIENLKKEIGKLKG